MAFLLTTRVQLDAFPELEAVLSTLRPVVGRTLRVDQETHAAVRRGRIESSWCPWPRTSVGFYVPGATTRGAEVTLARSGTGIDVKVIQPVLGTWTDWKLAVELAACLAEGAGAPIRLDPTTAMVPQELRRRFVADDSRWRSECLAGAEAVREAVEDGRIVRLGGPAGMAAIGPRSWARLQVEPGDEAPTEELLDLIQRSLEARGFETYYPANLLCLDGRSGREVIASLLAANVATILRDPEYVLLGDDLEDRNGPKLYLLRFDDLEDALPNRLIWLDDRTCAVPPILKEDWPAMLEGMRPWLTAVEDLLDSSAGLSGLQSGDWRALIPPEEEPPRPASESKPGGRAGPKQTSGSPSGPPPRPDRPWWKFW
jgi:hypothetical protein